MSALHGALFGICHQFDARTPMWKVLLCNLSQSTWDVSVIPQACHAAVCCNVFVYISFNEAPCIVTERCVSNEARFFYFKYSIL